MGTSLFAPGSEDVLVVVDLSAHLFRAYHAIRPLSSPQGEPTHAVYGVVTMLERLVKEVRPCRLAVALDSGRATFRAQIYPEYKANRPEAPEDLIVQLKRASEVVRAFTPHVWQKDGFEADDLIATAVSRATARGLKCLVVGADKDLMQLCSDDVRLWDTMRDKVFGPPEVQEKFGVRVDQLGDLLALTGDSSDNIPGVPGIGPKTAAELLNAYDTLDGIYSHVGDISRKRIRELLVTHEAMARLSRRLVQLDLDCDERVDPVHTQWHGRDEDRLRAIYLELGFSKFAAALGSSKREQGELALGFSPAQTTAHADSDSAQLDVSAQSQDYERLDSLEAARRWFECADTSKPWAVAFSALTEDKSQLVFRALAITDGSQRSAVFPLFPDTSQPATDSGNALAALVESQLVRDDIRLLVHGAKRFWLSFSEGSAKNVHVQFDTELASYLLDPTEQRDLSTLAMRLLGEKTILKAPSPSRKKAEIEVDRTDVERELVRDSRRIQKLTEPLASRLSDEGLEELLMSVELPLSRVLATMERRGVLVDTGRLAEMSVALDAELQRLEEQTINLVGHGFNLNSPRQLETILFDELGLKPQRRTKTSRSTDAATLEALAEEHPLPGLILQHRQVAKLKSTYVDALPHLVMKSTGRVHSSWEQTVTATGRLSSTEPNLQNIPIRTELGRTIRKAFVAPEGKRLISADYSQIELRILAHLSQDEALLAAFAANEDVHLHTAAAVFEVPESEVTPEMRRQAKAVNFGVIYGQGESGLATALGIPRHQASEFIAAYYRKYHGVRDFMNSTLMHARHGKAVRSLLGRRRCFPEIDSANRALRLSAERMAMNMPIQATAADILKLAMLKFEDPVTPSARMVMTVHDELVFEVSVDELDEAKEKIQAVMQNVVALAVPLLVDVGDGESWADAH